MFLRCLGGYGGLLFPGGIILLAPNLARPSLAAPPGAPTRPASGMSGFWIRQVGLHRISLVRASGETFKRRVFDALESAGKDCSLGEQFCWQTVLPDPTPPPRRAPRRDPPVVCPGFGFDKYLCDVAFRHIRLHYGTLV